MIEVWCEESDTKLSHSSSGARRLLVVKFAADSCIRDCLVTSVKYMTVTGTVLW